MPDKNVQWIIGSLIVFAGFMHWSVNGQIANLNTSLNARIDQLNTSLNARIDRLNTNLNARIDRIDVRLEGIDERLRVVENNIARIGFLPDSSPQIWQNRPILPLVPDPDRPIPLMPNPTDTERP